MAFNTAITGLKASTIELDVTGNNIANSSTVGYKSGRTEFADIFTTVVVGAGSTNNPGAGVIVSDIAQDFTAGTIEFTNNNLDLAIDGSGFFQLNDGQGGITYTRAGGFELDKDGNVISKSGKFLQGYGLDDAGNQQPIGVLAVDQKESAPQATENIDLSFNIDSRADAENLRQPYDPDDSASFTFSTTARSFDSLGNENTIKFDLVEQSAERERQTITFDAGTVGPTAPATTQNIVFAGVSIPVDPAGATATAAEIATAVATFYNSSPTPDPFRIDFRENIANLSANGNQVVVTFKAEASNVDPIVVNDDAFAPLNPANVSQATISASEVQRLNIFAPTVTANTNIIFGGVEIGVTPTSSQSDVVSGIIAQRNEILAANPDIDTIESTSTGIQITYKPEAGNVELLSVDDAGTGVFDVGEQQSLEITAPVGAAGAGDVVVSLSATQDLTVAVANGDSAVAVATKILTAFETGTFPGISATRDGATITFSYSGALGDPVDLAYSVGTATGPAGTATPEVVEYENVNTATLVETGDNSYEGVYQMFGYLNGDILLDIGRSVSPGEAGGLAATPATEEGPILLKFDPTNGVLLSVNGEQVSGDLAPVLTIEGADPADPENNIELDLSGTTQFASESIVKAATQDGFAKGDLIGITFANDGTMVASFSNGQNSNLGIVALATFENQSGLQSVGNTEWSATLDSGQAILNPPGTGLNGALRSAALEQSNVDLSEELVALIEAQRNFQANSKTLQTENSVTQTILQIQ